MPRLHLVTDDAVLARPSFRETAESVLACCGSDVTLHIRGHATTGARLYGISEFLAAACLRTGSWLVVNDRIDVARAVRANGVQLGARSLPIHEARMLLGPGARIGYSVHGVLEAAQAAADGADYVLMGTIFESASHADAAPAGLDTLRECAARAGVPVIAIGGVTPERVAAVAEAGAAGVAMLGAVWHQADPVTAASACVEAVQCAWIGNEEAG